MPKLTPAQMKAAVEEFKKKFTPGYYHGSPSPNIKVFDPTKSKKPEEYITPGVTFLTKNPSFAHDYMPTKGTASQMFGQPDQYVTGATMYPVSANLGKQFDFDTPEGRAVAKSFLKERLIPQEGEKKAANWLAGMQDELNTWKSLEHPDFLEHLKNQGYNSFAVKEAGIDNVGIFDPKNIRGKFAKFNPEDAESPDFMKAEGGPVQHFQFGGLAKLGNPALKLAKEISPKFSLEAIQKMPVSSAQKQVPVARAFQMLSSENVDPKVKQQIFKQYLQTHPDLVKKSGATNYDELTQAAYQQMAKETAGQFQALQGSGVKLSFDPTGEKAYKSSKEMLEDALQNKQLTVFQGGEPHPALGKEANEQFRAVHDYFGHGTTGASFGPKGEELAYGAHSQMYSPLARLAAATETRGQNSLVSYSGMNEELINAMNQLKAQREQLIKSGGDPSAINDQLVKLGQQFKYAPQKPLILPPEQIDINYPGFAGGGKIGKILEHAKSLPFVHFSESPSIAQLDPRMYGKGIKGAEAARLTEAPDIKPRSYFYVDKPGVKPEQGLGPHKYQGTAQDIYPLHEDPLGLSAIAKQKSLDPYLMSQGIQQVDEKQHLNELERLIKQAGYKGYANDDVGLLFYPTPVKKAVEEKAGGGKVGALGALAKKLMPLAEREANKAKFLENSVVKNRMYHATNADIKAFNPNMDARGNKLIFVSEDPDVAHGIYSMSKGTEGSNIMPVHIQTKNPFDPMSTGINPELEDWVRKNKKAIQKDLTNYNNDYGLGMGSGNYFDNGKVNIDKYIQNIKGGDWQAIEASPSLVKAIKNSGHDSIKTYEEGAFTHAVFEPTQIKSAIGNTGTYNPLDPDITKKRGGKVKK